MIFLLASISTMAVAQVRIGESEPYTDTCLPEAAPKDPTDVRLASARALQAFLGRNPAYRLLALEDIADKFFRWCLHDPSEVESMKRDKEESFRPVISADTNRDGRPDLVAVLVRAGRFSVVVFHGTSRGFGAKRFWVVRDETEIILGTHVSDSGAIVPLYCVSCDSNPWYYWIGANYEPWAHLPGHTVCIDRGSVAYSSASLKSKAIGKTDRLIEAEVVRIGPRGVNPKKRGETFRWYQVKAKADTSFAGYVPGDRLLEELGACE
jgi:hypothetical protein